MTNEPALGTSAESSKLNDRALQFRLGVRRLYEEAGPNKGDMWFFELWHFLGDVQDALAPQPAQPQGPAQSSGAYRALAEAIEESYLGDFVRDILLDEADRRLIVKALYAACRTPSETEHALQQEIISRQAEIELLRADVKKWTDAYELAAGHVERSRAKTAHQPPEGDR